MVLEIEMNVCKGERASYRLCLSVNKRRDFKLFQQDLTSLLQSGKATEGIVYS